MPSEDASDGVRNHRPSNLREAHVHQLMLRLLERGYRVEKNTHACHHDTPCDQAWVYEDEHNHALVGCVGHDTSMILEYEGLLP